MGWLFFFGGKLEGTQFLGVADRVNGGLLRLGRGVGVRVSHDRAGVAQHVASGDRVDAGLLEPSGEGVAQVVEGEAFEAGGQARGGEPLLRVYIGPAKALIAGDATGEQTLKISYLIVL